MPNRKDELRKRLLVMVEELHKKVMYTKDGVSKGDDEFFMRAVTLANYMDKQSARIRERAGELGEEATKFSKERNIA